MKPGENRPVTSNQTQKRTCSAAGFLPEPYIDHAVRGCVTHRISSRIPAVIQHSYRPAARVFTSSGPRFYELRSTRRTGRGKSNRLASEGTEPATSRVCPSRHAARGCARHNRFSCPTVSTTCLHSRSPQTISTAQQPCWLGELWPMSAKHGSTKFLGKRSPLNAPSRSRPSLLSFGPVPRATIL